MFTNFRYIFIFNFILATTCLYFSYGINQDINLIDIDASGQATLFTNSSKESEEIDEVQRDFVNYFETYSYLYEQKRMLEDEVRMRSYYRAIFKNKDYFKDKVVLDVGTGTGILAMWIAKCGAKRVYAVEYTDMAIHAKRLVEHNNLSSIVQVIKSSAEDLELPEKVDAIISEWQGMVLLRESMLDSVNLNFYYKP